MKSYAIHDGDRQDTTAIGYLFYFERAKSFIVELCEDLDEWEAPLLFQSLVRKGIYTVPRDISLMWVQERVIPSGRQNIGSILKNHKLNEYNEVNFLVLSKGKCSQDNCYIVEVEQVPENIRNRMRKNVRECFPTADKQLVCMFQDNSVRMIDLMKVVDKYKDISYVLKHREILESVEVGAGGYSVLFNGSIEIQSLELNKLGVLLPLTADDFYSFVRRNVVDATKACDVLQCSRQNLSYMVKEGKITPIIYGTKEYLYTRGELERIMSE